MTARAARNPDDVWHRYAPEQAALSDLETRVHVWRARLGSLPPGFGDNLSDDEQARAARFYRVEDRDCFVTTRSVLRRILANCLHLPEASNGHMLRFFYGPAGKPFLADDPSLRFSVSHAEGLALIAVTRAGEVGVDLERDRPMKDMDGIVRLVFNDTEQAAMLGCPPAARSAVFYRIWTRKEALLKAMGVGLPALSDPNSASLTKSGSNWFMMSLPHLDGYVAALARPRNAHGLKLWSWSNAAGLRDSERRKTPRPMPTQHAVHAFEVHQ